MGRRSDCGRTVWLTVAGSVLRSSAMTIYRSVGEGQWPDSLDDGCGDGSGSFAMTIFRKVAQPWGLIEMTAGSERRAILSQSGPDPRHGFGQTSSQG
jgi:hypothetical protein